MEGKKADQAIAVPTKQFFVSMLTRDIGLADAILDLIDNCLDGALRLSKGSEIDYSKYIIDININDNFFSILDNCGGIPRDIAMNYAFKMGRDPDDIRDLDNETIGMYGVGMKRAIFKMGRNAYVQSFTGDDAFKVPISAMWLDEKGWEPLPMLVPIEKEKLTTPGTMIYVDSLFPSVIKHFKNVSFLNELKTAISEHFTMFLQKGLAIKVNNENIQPVLVEILVSSEQKGPAPFVFQNTKKDITVSITVGLNTGRGFSDTEDDDSIDFERDRSAATAGWTVFCNDRAVIVGDKSRLTGWGDGLPLYHYQYSIITGIIEFRSKNADKLPVTTTKRALDTSSDVWLEALVKMKEGMRIWISYTNAWKNHPRANQTVFWESATPLPLRKAIELVAERGNSRKSDGTIEFNPQKQGALPFPPTQIPSSRKIVFSRPIEEIRQVSKLLFDSFDEKPGIVGDKCFDVIFNKTVDSKDK